MHLSASVFLHPQFHSLFLIYEEQDLMTIKFEFHFFVFILTCQIKICDSCVCFQCFTQQSRTFVSDFVFCLSSKYDFLCFNFTTCSFSLRRLRCHSFLFIFTASAIAFVPTSPTVSSVFSFVSKQHKRSLDCFFISTNPTH